jgi:hypothetical protein
MQVPTDAQFFSREDPSKPDIAFLKNHFYREGRLTEDQALYILDKATEIIRNEPTLLSLNAPITGALIFRACHHRIADICLSLRRYPRTIRMNLWNCT